MKFGTSGLRGLSVDLLGKASFAYPAAYVRYLKQRGIINSGDKVLIGRDFRDSSEAIAKNAAAALTSEGFVPVDCGTLPTPALAYYGQEHGFAGIMITGSHIPADRNGLKFYRPDGEIDKSDETGISDAAKQTMEEDWQSAVGRLSDESGEAEALFVERNRQILPPNALAGLKVGVYQHSTVARDMLVDILKFYGCDVVELGRSETFIPVDTEAVSPETVEATQKWVAELGLHSVVSADGDGDRPLVTDEKGVPIKGDILGLICAAYLNADTVVTPITSNSGIEASGRFKVVRTRVGSPYVISGMENAEGDGIIGFEANGGTLTGSAFDVDGRELKALPTRDCFLPILTALASAKHEGLSLSAYCASLKLPVTAADRLQNFPLEQSAALMDWLREDPENVSSFLTGLATPEDMSDLDGLRVSLSEGRSIHFRPSGNAPEMRCYVEAPSAEEADALLAKGLERIRNWEAPQA
ncbi:phosphomannomutase [Rhizobium sp. L1K21]|uniref:phosphomannomutase n=1 Tax=Rhizobium sp. L1K21 TaxID=2954933 RepID=UPI0020923A93|nr:phosphomannomutase [Rhizobium sp. L1K21]MCO6186617.1 phosphomannomutase [Rhizobium sp. L1K21]